ncbi:MAG: HAD hydrolase-like protein [Gammaproteobacteria bacterium]|nr:HAD hydrolase-like protein [Gammaproteobacteria bacterium]
MPSIPTAVFDFDGTLANSMAVGLDVYNVIARRSGFPTLDQTGFQTIRQLSVPEILSYLGVPRWRLPCFILQGRRLMHRRSAEIQPYPGVRDLINRLLENDIRVAVLTANSRAIVQQFFQRHEMKMPDFVDSTRWRKGKHQFLREREKENRRLIYVTDEARDIVLAQRASVPVVAVDWGFNTRERLLKARPDRLVSDTEQLNTAIIELLKPE